MEPKTFRGLSLAEVERKVRAELGPDAVIVRQREGLTGGVGGFFQRRLYEVDALPGDEAPDVERPTAAGQAAAGFSEPEVAAAFQRHLQAAQDGEPVETADPYAAPTAAQAFVADAFPQIDEPAPAPISAAPGAAYATPASRGGDARALAALFAPDTP